MRPIFTGLMIFLTLLGGCSGPCNCDEASSVPHPTGDFTIDDATRASLAGGAATITDEVALFLYTDDDGNVWEVEYAVVATGVY